MTSDETSGGVKVRKKHASDVSGFEQAFAEVDDVLGADLAGDPETAALWLGARIRAERIACGWTQAELADRARLTQGRLSAIESGQGKEGPGLRVVNRVANALGMAVALVPRDSKETAN